MRQQPSDVASATEPRISLREKLAYAVGDVGSNVVFIPITTFLLFYLTNVVGIGAALAGTILLIGQLLNGVTDLVVGALIDKTNTRWGKTRPWILFTSVPLAVAFVLTFSIPAGLPEGAKIAWALVAYSLVIAVFFTASNVAYSALLSVVTPSPKTRVTLTTFRFLAATITGVVVGLITLPLVDALGGGQGGWTSVASIYGLVCAATLITVFLGTRERVTQTPEARAMATPPLRTQLRDLFRNGYFYLAAGLFIVFYLLSGITSATGVYYAAEVLGNASLYGILGIGQVVPLIIGLPFMPLFIGRVGKRNAFLVGTAFMLVGTLIPLLGPSQIGLVIIGLIVRGIGMVPFASGLFAIVADVVDYGEWRYGVRTDGLIFSSVVFGQKVGGGLASAVTGWVLAAGGYAASATAQSPSAVQSILSLYIYIPIVLVLIGGVIVWFFRIERHRPAIAEFLAAKPASK